MAFTPSMARINAACSSPRSSSELHAAAVCPLLLALLLGERAEALPAEHAHVHVHRGRGCGVGCRGKTGGAVPRALRDLGVVEQTLGEGRHAAQRDGAPVQLRVAVARGEHHVQEDHHVRAHQLVVLSLGHAPLGLREQQVGALLPEEDALGLDPLNLEDAVVADVDHLPQARGVRYAHDAHEKLLLHRVQHLFVPVVAVRAG